jgi:Thioredoxin-like
MSSAYNAHMRVIPRCLTAVLLFASLGAAASPPSAAAVMSEAKAQAAAQGKSILLIFDASWCQWCRHFDRFIADRNVKPIFNRHFVIARVDVQERGGKKRLDTPGGAELEATMGGEDKTGLPFFALLNSNGKLIVNSLRPVRGKPAGANIGYPVAPEEVDWFMTMLRKAVPPLTPAESRAIENYFRDQKKN